MSNRRHLLAALLFALLTVDAGAVHAQPKILEGLDEFIENSMKQWRVPGLAIAVVKDGKIVLQKGYGVRTVNKPGRVDGNTMFAIASQTKAYTATALGLLVHEGKIGWDDRVLKYLPSFALPDPVATRKITIRDLLCHRAGLGECSGDLILWDAKIDRKEVMRRIRFLDQAYDLRTRFAYNNMMYMVAGEVIAVVTGKSWSDFIRKRFFEPLGMKRSNTSLDELARMDNVATPHVIRDGKVLTSSYLDFPDKAAGAINSCVKDMSNWMLLQLAGGKFEGKQIVDGSIIEATRRSHTLLPATDVFWKLLPDSHFFTYGLGWFLGDLHGQLLVMHSGGLPGMLSNTVLVPEEKLGVVVVTNLEDHYLMYAVTFHVVEAYLGVETRDWNSYLFDLYRKKKQKAEQKKQKQLKARVLGTRTTHALVEYAGSYEDKVYGQATIRYSKGKLTLHLEHHPEAVGKLTHWHHDVFRCQWSDRDFGEGFVYFDFDEEMEIERFRITIRPEWIDTREYKFVRK